MSGPAELLTFSHQRAEYEFETDSKGRRIKLGEGLWSDVYLAKPCLPKLGRATLLDPSRSCWNDASHDADRLKGL